MEDRKFAVYSEPGVYLGGEIKNGCLHLESDVFGELDSEQHYSFSKEDTDKLFSLISFEDFCEFSGVNTCWEWMNSLKRMVSNLEFLQSESYCLSSQPL